MFEDLQEALDGLTDDDLDMVSLAAAGRVRHMLRTGVAVDKQMAARIIIEYADEARARRPLNDGFHAREEVLFSRNYNCFYQSPGKREESL